MSEPGAVVVLAPNWLGDAVMALPALADIRRHFADQRLVVGARPTVSSLFTLVPGVDSIVTTDISSLRGVRTSVAILFPNSFASAWAVKRAGIPERWGYSRDMRRLLLTRAIPRPRKAMHQSEYYQHLVSALGVDNGPREVTLIVPPNAVDEGRKILVDNGWSPDSALAVLAPGAAYGKAKQWIPAHVVRLITDLVRDRGMTCALVGSRGDAPSTRAMRSAAPADCQPRILDLAGHHIAGAFGHHESGARMRVERFGRDAPGRRRGCADGRGLRTDQRARDLTVGTGKRPDRGRIECGLVSSLYAS